MSCPTQESSATNTLERPLKRRKSRGSRGSRNKRKGEGGGGEITPKRQSREYRDEVNRMKRNSKKKGQQEPLEKDAPEVDQQPPAEDEDIQQQPAAEGLSRNRKRSSKKRATIQQGGNSIVY